MRLYIDQMLRADLTDELRDQGHDVIRAGEVGQRQADDDDILAAAIEDDRILVTLDEHFGDWVVLPLRRHPGVIRLKIDPTTPENAARLLIPLLSGHEQSDFRDHLVIASGRRTRWVRTAAD